MDLTILVEGKGLECAAARDPPRSYDEPVWRRADIIERIARHQRQNRLFRRCEDLEIGRFHDSGPFDRILIGAVQSIQENGVVAPNASEFAKESIPMSSDSNIAKVAGRSCAGNMASPDLQNARTHSFMNHYRKAEPGNFQTAYGRRRWLCVGIKPR